MSSNTRYRYLFSHFNSLKGCNITISDGAIAKIDWEVASSQDGKPLPDLNTATEPVAHALEQWLQAYEHGRWSDLPKLAKKCRVAFAGTPFQSAVWRAIAAIPAGETRSYGELARVIGAPRAARAIGAACGRNPVPILVPCHRVVSATGIGGFSGPPAVKRELLAFEGASLEKKRDHNRR